MNKLQRYSLLALLGLAVFALPAMADWDPATGTHKMHWPQLPDLTETGMDILATRQGTGASGPWKILADDWRCSETGPVSDIHIWGSWLSDLLPNGMLPGGLIAPNAGNVQFKLSIHKDIPATTEPPEFSRPGQLLWQRTFLPGEFSTRLYHAIDTQSPPEKFFDPNTGQVIGTDRQVWQYNFANIANPFPQVAGTIYWLDVQAAPLDPAGFQDPGKKFGWKTTDPDITLHFMDDAVFGDTEVFEGPLLPPGWRELAYNMPPHQGRSIDMAFVITPEPGTVAMLVGAGLVGLGLLIRRRRVR